MIDKLKRLALSIQVLRLPSLSVGFISLISLVVIILFFESEQDALFVIPCIVGFLWGISAYTFIVTFRAVPQKPSTQLRFFGKLKYAITRIWYWLLSVVFLGATVALIVVTIRMVSIWLRE
jgi:hypothetical protein